MSPIVTLLRNLSRYLVTSKDRRPSDAAQANGRQLELDEVQINRLMMVKIGWTLSILICLVTFAPDGSHLDLFERLLNACSMADALLAVLLHQRWTATGLSRWDEAILFATISLGLRLFA